MKLISIAALAAVLMATSASAESLLNAARGARVPECKVIGTVYRLDPNGYNNLSVRQSPSGRAGLAYEIDELYTGQEVCIAGMRGVWAHVFYFKYGRAGSGWVHSAYVSVE